MPGHKCLTEQVFKNASKGEYVSKAYMCKCGKAYSIKVSYLGSAEAIAIRSAPYEAYVQPVKDRDGNKCVKNCGRKPAPEMLRVVRIDPFKADTMTNLETVCRWCAPDWE